MNGSNHGAAEGELHNCTEEAENERIMERRRITPKCSECTAPIQG